MLQKIIETQLELAEKLTSTQRRYLYNKISWKEKGLVITGPRGVGKTTLLLQRYKEQYNNPNKCLYAVGDDIDVVAAKLIEIADAFYKKGGECLMVDEVHKYPNWSQEIKNIYDRYPSLQLVLSGSSTLEINKGKFDLSRRLALYNLKGLSFREFIEFELNRSLKTYTLKEVVSNHFEISREVRAEIGKEKVLNLFERYLNYGYFPYYKEGVETFQPKLLNALNKVLYEDIPASFGLKSSSVPSLQKLVSLVSGEKPFLVDITRISSTVGISREYVSVYLDYLEKAEIFIGLKRVLHGHGSIRKPEKLYISSPSLYLAINKDFVNQENVGIVREIFAISMLSNLYPTTFSETGDFMAEGVTLEVGGKSKVNKLSNYKPGTLFFLDDIESGQDNVVPLYLLGFLY